MERIACKPRHGWQSKVEAHGLIWHTADGKPYWNEAAAYRFTLAEIITLETATNELYPMFLAAGDHVLEGGLLSRFGIPEWTHALIRDAWEAEPPALNYGRFDLGFDGRGDPKLFEFNCDTPTSLLEAAVIQWDWKNDRFPGLDQFNSLHEKLVARWRAITPHLKSRTVHFAHVNDEAGEDSVTTAYLADTAQQAGLEARPILMADIGWDGQVFVDAQSRAIDTTFKLYPWEWLVRERFGEFVPRAATLWIEPIWKMIWSNKAILPVLWELYPGHPLLLRASFDRPTGEDVSYVSKPLLAREGANVTLFRNGQPAERTGGLYDGPLVYQELYDLPDFDGRRPVIGSWIVDGQAAGMGIREDGPITGNKAQFVPHIIDS